ncbi:ABC transporter permease subunit [Rhodobacteraceae bacterium DSL-40]|uniref:ABC transporter permease n=1 Tax=Amaricoccus sp. B4 TaxID=3368557 RepID=UPI000DAB7CE8
MPERPGLLALAPAVTLGLIALPVLAGLAGTILPGLGLAPALGGTRLDLAPWAALLATPGLWRSAALSLGTGLAATVVSLALTTLILAAWHGTRPFRLIERALSPLLSVPHAAAAFGLAFLIAPSGWAVRAVSPWATGWQTPPDWLLPGDPLGLSLIAGLAAKEVPFLLLMSLAALPQADAARARRAALTLGYGPSTAWLKAVFPRIYPQIRLPVFAVLAFSLANVETALILGPSTPATLAVRLTQWMRDPDLALWLKAAAGATLQLGLVLAALALWRLAEAAATRLGRAWITRGTRHPRDRLPRAAGALAAALATLPMLAGLASLAVWSVAGLWSFPDALPASLTLRAWSRAAPELAGAALTTLGIAAGATALSLALVLACLENATRRGRGAGRALLALLYLPLVVPQVAFLFGLQILGLMAGLDGGPLAVTLAHTVFVLPYVYLSLAEPWAALDPRLAAAAATLGAPPGRIFRRVRLPMMLRPILTAAAVGLAVSIGLYLPTLLIGAGRVATLTTEAVALASGGDRRLIGTWALVQAALPFAGFALALGLPALLWRNRRAMRPAR